MSVPLYFNAVGAKYFEEVFENQKQLSDQTLKMLHLGAYSGHGTKWMLDRFGGSCIDVDTWNLDVLSDAEIELYRIDSVDIADVENLYDQIVSGINTVKFKGTTLDFFKQNKQTFNFIYIDASHNKHDVAHDLRESFKVLDSGGIIGCDDYLWHLELDAELRPHDAINEFLKLHENEVEIIVNDYQLWFKKINLI